MRKLMNYSLMMTLLAAMVVFSSCKRNRVDPVQDRKEELEGTWNVTKAVADGTDVPVSGVTISFQIEGNYSIGGFNNLNEANLNHSSVASASGNFVIDEENVNRVILDGDAANKTIVFTAFDVSGSATFTYQSAFPKAGDEKKTIAITVEKQ